MSTNPYIPPNAEARDEPAPSPLSRVGRNYIASVLVVSLCAIGTAGVGYPAASWLASTIVIAVIAIPASLLSAWFVRPVTRSVVASQLLTVITVGALNFLR